MSKANSDRPSVLVTDSNRGSAINIIRSLGQKGIRVIAADSSPLSPGLHSRYTTESLIYPVPETAPLEFTETLEIAVRRRKIDLIIPVTDEAIMPLSKARGRFNGICELAIPEPQALEVVRNKLKTLDLARQSGVPAPCTQMVHTVEEALENAPAFGWPIVLKPMVSRQFLGQKAIESFKVSYAENPEQLTNQMHGYEGRCPVLLQEYCPGTGYGIELLLHQGCPLAAFQHKRLREIPINGGASSFRESVTIDPVLYEYSIRMMRELCWTGLAMVEFKVGQDGPKLMEINGRVWGSLPLAVLSGMDFPARLVDLYFNGPTMQTKILDNQYKIGVRSRNLELEVIWILTVLIGKKRFPFLPMPTRKQSIHAILQLFNPAYRFDILSLSDPIPGLFEIVKIIRKIKTKMNEVN